MAQITSNEEVRIFTIDNFKGLNESEDGDTNLKMGEAAKMDNWRVTNEGHIKVRPGYRTIKKFNNPVRGLWSGYVAGKVQTVCAADGGLYVVEGRQVRKIGDCWDAPTTFFGFQNKLYVLNGHEYLVWDGEGEADSVEGYVPLTVTAIAPEGGGTTVENVNRLTGKRRVKFSADGKAKEYHLPEKNINGVEKIEIDGKRALGWSVDKAEGIITFVNEPAEGNSNVQVWYSVRNTLRGDVESMRFAEQFNGAADTRVFLYGDGTAKAIYCGVTEDGKASAEYFPDLYEVQIGSDNAPVTGMVKYYDRMMSFKPDGGAYSTTYNVTTLADGSVIPSFQTVSINKEIGNMAMGQVRLVKNVPRTLYGGNLYDWVYANYGVRDERNAKLISQRVQDTLRNANTDNVFVFDDDSRQEYYVFLNDKNGTALVHNYQTDTWYRYNNMPVTCAGRFTDDIYFGLGNGKLVRFSEEYASDDNEPIRALFVSGSMNFDRGYMRKHSSVMWVSLKPTDNANLTITARSDKRADYTEKVISRRLATFVTPDFGNWSFETNRAPQVQRVKIKVKKFSYLSLVLKANMDDSGTDGDVPLSDATVLGVELRVRSTGYVK